MNNGKVCISICAPTADEVFEKIERARPLADVIEIRFDCLAAGDADAVLERLKSTSVETDLLATARPKEANATNADFESRLEFWRTILQSRLFKYIDLEEDLVFALNHTHRFDDELLKGHTVIGSHHDFYETPPDLTAVVDVFTPDSERPFNCDVVKVATTANTITDTIEQWRLLEWACEHGIASVPISMGEPGKWTRVLGLAHGAAMTYASLDDESGTAPGQISASDLIDVYRVRELNSETEVFGVIAGNTSYSMSPYIQNAAFGAAGMNRVFVPLQVDDVAEFIRRMVRSETAEIDLNSKGFAVTNPHKQWIMPLLDEMDEAAIAIGAVNTVKIDGDKLCGYNTDADGFIRPLVEKLGDINGANATVVGSGGAARACAYALRKQGANVTIAARNRSDGQKIADDIGCEFVSLEVSGNKFTGDILVNATPLGTKGALADETVATADQLKDVRLVNDLTYNPRETRLMREARNAGCETLDGLPMLIAQGAKQFEIWTGELPDKDAMQRAAISRLEL